MPKRMVKPGETRRRMTLLCLLALAGASLYGLPAHAETAPALRGKSVQRAITLMEAQHGVAVYYSSDLVTPWMSVRSEPGGDDPADLLSQIVAPYALAVERGPQDSLLITRRAATAPDHTGDLLGIVKETGSGNRVSGAEVSIIGQRLATKTSLGGHFSFSDLAPGSYVVQINQSERAVITTVVADVEPGKTSVALINVKTPEIRELGTMVVNASRYQIDRRIPPSHRFLAIEDIEKLPDLGDDPLRSINRLPGTANNSVTAKSNIRGGETDESLVQFDGLRLFDPFHLKDFQSIFSTIDPRIVSSLDVYTGGFPATFGDCMSGVIDIGTLDPSATRINELGLSFFNASILSAGPLDGGRGDWLVSARRGNLNLLLDAVDSDLGDPRYVDVYTRLGYQVTDRLRVSAHFLYFGDDINLKDPDDEEDADADYDDYYYWLRLDYDLTGSVSGHTIASRAELDSKRSGTAEKEGVSHGWLNDDRNFTINSLQSQLSWRAADNLRLELGGELRQQEGKYDYQDAAEFELVFLTPGASLEPERERDIRTRPDGYQYGLYTRAQIELTDKLAADAGLRWDRQTLGANSDSQFSPRLGLMYGLTDSTELRASWGRFYQSQSVNELQVSDGVVEFDDAQRADHLVLSVEQTLPRDIVLRVEAYEKDMDDLRPRYENFLNPLVLLPELTPDRVRIDPDSARARGIETSLWGKHSAWLDWWVTYSWSTVKDRFERGNVRRAWDQQQALRGGMVMGLGYWEFSIAGDFHSGWPTTPIELLAEEPQIIVGTGPRNSKRLGDFKSVDIRIARELVFQRSSATLFLEVANVFDWNNECCIQYDVDDEDGPLELDTESTRYLPIFASLGLVWRF